jgi:hypothetical protein
MKHTATVLGLCLAIAGVASAQAAAPALPTAEQVLEKYVAAIGGKAAWDKITSRVSKGTFEVPDQGAGGAVQIFAKAPDKTALIIEVDGFGTVRQAYNGNIAWDDNPQSGFRELSGEELANRKRSADFYRPFNLRTHYPKMSVKGQEKVAGRDAYVIEADTGSGKPHQLFFDSESGLLVRTVVERDTPQGPITVESYLEDYRELDGIKIPFTQRQQTPFFSSVIRLKEVQHNVPIDDKQFDKP